MAFTADLAARTAERDLGRIPDAALAVVKSTLLDTIAVALAGRDERVSRAVRGFVATETPSGPCAIWGTGLRAGPSLAALANATAAHALDYDDVCWAMNAHPSAVLWPTSLAVAESIGASGAAAIVGYVAGFEAQADLGAFVGKSHYAAGWHPTSTLGTVAAAIAAGKILSLDEPALRRAIGIACSEASGSRMNFGTDTKPFHAGHAARSGVTAALLAASGVTAREDGVEAAMGLAALYAADGAHSSRSGFALLDPGIEQKPYPSCRFTHRIIDAVLALRSRRGARALESLESLECVVDPFAEHVVIYPRPRNGLEAKFSMQYCAAIAWLDGEPTLESFTDRRACLEDVQGLLTRVRLRPGSPASETATAIFADETRDAETVVDPTGSPARPLSDETRLRKLRACAGPALGDRLEALVRIVGSSETLRDIRDLTSLLA